MLLIELNVPDDELADLLNFAEQMIDPLPMKWRLIVRMKPLSSVLKRMEGLALILIHLALKIRDKDIKTFYLQIMIHYTDKYKV